jgi:hypothetical protein
MNFLSHYLLAKEHDQSPLFLVGSILPDLAKRAGFSTPKVLFKNESNQDVQLLNGVKFHLKTDKYFHNDSLFKQGIQFWKTDLDEKNIGLSKSFFLHHLLFEMWLDQILLFANPGSANEMYFTLESADFKLLKKFLSDFYLDRNDKIIKVFDGFINRKFVLSYLNPFDFTHIASGVFSHTTNQTIPEHLPEILLKKLDSMKINEAHFLALWENFKTEFLKP